MMKKGDGVIVTRFQTNTAEAFVNARRDAKALDRYPGEKPEDLAAAYTMQDEAIRIGGRRIAGWKVGRIPAPTDARLGDNRLAGPIFADTVFEGQDIAMPVFVGGFAAAESEFMLRLTIPADTPLPKTDEETLAWVDEVRIGVEIASSPYAGINADGPCVTVSDHGNNAGIVLGEAITDWRQRDLRDVEISTIIDGETIGTATAAAMLDGPLGAVRWLLAHLHNRGIAAESGWWVSSGAVTGVHEVEVGQNVVARFGGIGEVRCSIAAA